MPIKPLDIDKLTKTADNIYEAIVVLLKRSRQINELFAGLSAAGLQVASLRNKTNRLEELFVTLTERKDKLPASRPGETRP